MTIRAYIEEGVVHYCVSNIPGSHCAVHFHSLCGLGASSFQKHHEERCGGARERDGYLRRSLTTYKRIPDA